MADGIRVLINGADGKGAVLDVTVPGGAYNSSLLVGWKANSAGTTFTYLNKLGLGGITKVAIKLNANLPGVVSFTVVGPTASFRSPRRSCHSLERSRSTRRPPGAVSAAK